MKFKTQLSEEEFIEEILRWSGPKKVHTDMKPCFRYKDELIGGVYGNKFWLQKTRPHYMSFRQRAFYARIKVQNGCVVFNGHFRYTPATYTCYTIFFLLIYGPIFFADMGTLNFLRKYFIVLLIPIAFTFLFSVINKAFFRKEEEFVIKYLKSL